MRIYVIRWNTGGFAVVAANSKREARERFDEWGESSDFPDNEIHEVQNFGADFTPREVVGEVPVDTLTFDVDFSGISDPLLPLDDDAAAHDAPTNDSPIWEVVVDGRVVADRLFRSEAEKAAGPFGDNATIRIGGEG